jgi:hypothetical protein
MWLINQINKDINSINKWANKLIEFWQKIKENNK